LIDCIITSSGALVYLKQPGTKLAVWLTLFQDEYHTSRYGNNVSNTTVLPL